MRRSPMAHDRIGAGGAPWLSLLHGSERAGAARSGAAVRHEVAAGEGG